MTLKRSLAGLLFTLLIAPQLVFAHATPVLYEPDSAALVASMPKEIVIRFSERIESVASSIQIFAPDGTRAEEGTVKVDEKDPYRLSIGLKSDEKGSFAVAWSVVSADDGHFTKGGFIFSIGTRSAVQPTLQFQLVQRKRYQESLNFVDFNYQVRFFFE